MGFKKEEKENERKEKEEPPHLGGGKQGDRVTG